MLKFKYPKGFLKKGQPPEYEVGTFFLKKKNVVCVITAVSWEKGWFGKKDQYWYSWRPVISNQHCMAEAEWMEKNVIKVLTAEEVVEFIQDKLVKEDFARIK